MNHHELLQLVLMIATVATGKASLRWLGLQTRELPKRTPQDQTDQESQNQSQRHFFMTDKVEDKEKISSIKSCLSIPTDTSILGQNEALL